MKRSKEIITNRRHMHCYQQKYRLWRHIISTLPILLIPVYITNDYSWNTEAWLKYARQGIILVDDKGESSIEIIKNK